MKRLSLLMLSVVTLFPTGAYAAGGNQPCQGEESCKGKQGDCRDTQAPCEDNDLNFDNNKVNICLPESTCNFNSSEE